MDKEEIKKMIDEIEGKICDVCWATNDLTDALESCPEMQEECETIQFMLNDIEICLLVLGEKLKEKEQSGGNE